MGNQINILLAIGTNLSVNNIENMMRESQRCGFCLFVEIEGNTENAFAIILHGDWGQ